MKRKTVKFGVFIAVGFIATTMTVLANKEHSATDDLLQQNIEALSSSERPDVRECVYDPIQNCWALHPTNPSLDVMRPFSRW